MIRRDRIGESPQPASDRRRRRPPVALLAALLLAVPGAAPPPPRADLVLLGGTIVTLDEQRPRATALAVRGDTVAALGDDREIRAWVGSRTRVIDLGGRFVMPGFIEGHGHFMGLGAALGRLRLARARTWEEVVAAVERAAREARPGEWILGRGWHQEKWERPAAPAVQGFPTHEALSRAAPRHPVMLVHASGHASIVNAEALRLAGIGRGTPDPPGGQILRDEAGEPTGVLIERADEPVEAALDAWRRRRSKAEIEAAALRDVERATRECLSHGVTSFQDAGADLETVARYERLAASGRLGLRLWVMLRDSTERLERELARRRPPRGRWLAVGAVKCQIDGALGSRGAWLLEPYADAPASTGLNTLPIPELRRLAELCERHRLQLCVHAIGDRANREALDVFEATFRAAPGRDRRWRIEHAQHLDPADQPRFARLGVIASIQGVHCTSDAPWVPARIGPRRAREGAYVWRSLLDSGARIVNGTDTPVEDVDPIACIAASVTRRLPDGSAFHPEQRMTREEALRSYTADAAYAAFEEGLKGRLRPGLLADLVVLSGDLLAVPDSALAGVRVDLTVVGGRVAHERPR